VGARGSSREARDARPSRPGREKATSVLREKREMLLVDVEDGAGTRWGAVWEARDRESFPGPDSNQSSVASLQSRDATVGESSAAAFPE
jgi:hypothetical protein